MGGFLDVIQRATGRALKAVHRAGGYRVSYTLCTDGTVEGLAPQVLDIYLLPSSTEFTTERQGGRDRLRPVSEDFEVSRENLVYNGTYYAPTHHDTFVAYGTTSPVYRVTGYRESQMKPGTWVLNCTTLLDQHAAG